MLNLSMEQQLADLFIQRFVMVYSCVQKQIVEFTILFEKKKNLHQTMVKFPNVRYTPCCSRTSGQVATHIT